MDKAALVNIELERGAEILRALDNAGLKVKVIVWLLLPEYDEWRLVLASPEFDAANPIEAYGLVHKALDAAKFPAEQTPPLLILPMSDTSIRALRRVSGKAKSVLGMRLGGQMIGDRFVEDGYVYRIS